MNKKRKAMVHHIMHDKIPLITTIELVEDHKWPTADEFITHWNGCDECKNQFTSPVEKLPEFDDADVDELVIKRFHIKSVQEVGDDRIITLSSMAWYVIILQLMRFYVHQQKNNDTQ